MNTNQSFRPDYVGIEIYIVNIKIDAEPSGTLRHGAKGAHSA
jgi:hypothetical protein